MNNKKALMRGAGAVLAYLYFEEKKEKKEKKVNIPNLSISPPVFYA